MSLTADQIERRRSGIGGSDVAKILGFIEDCGPVRLAKQKRGELPEDEIDTVATRFGSFAEPFLRSEFERMTGLVVVDRPTEVTHPEHEWLRGNLDGWVQDTDGALCVLELKTAAFNRADDPLHAWGESGTDVIPLGYRCQVTHYLAVTGAPRAYVFVLIGGKELRWFRIDRDERQIAALIERERAFWQHVLDGTDPEPASYEDVRVRFASATAGKVADLTGDAEFAEALRQDIEGARLEKEGAEIRKAARSVILSRAGDAESVEVDGFQVATLKEQSARRIDPKLLRDRFPEAAAECEVESTTRVIRLTKHAKELIA